MPGAPISALYRVPALQFPPTTLAMDIDDILASVDRGPGASPESAALDHQLLTRFWVAERAVTEVLPWPAPLMERMMDRVRMQVKQSSLTPAIQFHNRDRL